MENFPMMTAAKADKIRRTIHGLAEKKSRLEKTGMSAAAFAKLYRSRTPLDADTAKAIAANLAAIDKAR